MWRSVFSKKDLNQIFKEEESESGEKKNGLKRTLGSFNLTMIGIGAIIGAGIFSITGTAASLYAGPAIIFSFVLAGVLSAFAGLCYAEMASMIPLAGSAYTYSYATMGELVAWIIGWDLILEYTFSGVAISASWSSYALSIVTKTLGIPLSDTLIKFSKGPWELVTLNDGTQVNGYWNIPASVVALGIASIVYKGIRESAWVNNLTVLVKLVIIVAFIALGWTVIDSNLWIASPGALGFSKLVPDPEMILRNGREMLSYGWPGVLTGAGVVFFAFIGFDMISTTAQECKNPAKDLPVGILASLVVCTILYVAMALVMTGVVHYRKLGVSDPIALGIDQIVVLHGWSLYTQKVITFIVKFGALAGLTSGLLVVILGQSRIFYAMARDGLLPWFDQVHKNYKTPHIATFLTAITISIFAGVMPISLVGELVSIGTLLAFMVVCIGIPILRIKNPEIERPFKVPFQWIIAPAGALTCLWVMTGLPRDTWVRLLVWLLLGLGIYFFYGIKQSKLRHPKTRKSR